MHNTKKHWLTILQCRMYWSAGRHNSCKNGSIYFWLSQRRMYVYVFRAVTSGGAVVPGPPFKICSPPFTFGPLVATCIQYSIFKMWPPLLLYPGDGPVCIMYLTYYKTVTTLSTVCRMERSLKNNTRVIWNAQVLVKAAWTEKINLEHAVGREESRYTRFVLCGRSQVVCFDTFQLRLLQRRQQPNNVASSYSRWWINQTMKRNIKGRETGKVSKPKNSPGTY